MTRVYKICPAAVWAAAEAAGHYAGAPVDLQDGFIHLSAAHQLEGTAAKHFAGQDGLVLVAFEAEALAPALRWETSRGGDLFPHVYGVLDPGLALWVKPLPWAAGGHQFPELGAP